MSFIERIYIHVPFCESKCHYCAFHSLPSPQDSIIDDYLRKLEQDIYLRPLPNPLRSLYIGGGTPSYLSDKKLERLFDILNVFKFRDDAEISIECNPDSLTERKIDLISGFANRVSLGVQTFNKAHRQIIGRIADPENVLYLVNSFLKRNLSNISCDLIYGIPTQTIEDFKYDLLQLFELPIKHFSAYSLTIEENSKLDGKLTSRELETIDSAASEIWEIMPEIIKERGFSRYEISNYSLEGYECQHNCAAWFGASYFGFGPAASSFDGTDRWTNPEFSEWLAGKAPIVDSISRIERVNEIFAMGLRTSYYWTINKDVHGVVISSRFGIIARLTLSEWDVLQKKLDSLNEQGFLRMESFNYNEIMVKSSAKGLAFWNDVAMNII